MFNLTADNLTLFGLLFACIELTAFWMVYHVLLYGRTSQGTLAWILCLIFLPFIGVPLFLLFGRRRFHGYLQARRQDSRTLENILPPEVDELILEHSFRQSREDIQLPGLERLSAFATVANNQANLLIDGENTFTAIFSAIDVAEDYILLQTYILRPDRTGSQLKDKLIEKARLGIRILLLYDAIGSYGLPSAYRRQMEEVGIQVHSFSSGVGWHRRFQVNFRNHRKIIIVDGKVGFVGGLNFGDEYREETKKFGHWRDTHLQVSGPVVQELQLAFLDDWYWACHQIPALSWKPDTTEEGFPALVVPTGPADDFDSGSLFMLALISRARKRLWLTSPYFVPDEAVAAALQLAALRGVDVRVILPGRPDKYLPWLAAGPWMQQVGKAGVRFFRYQPGFLHQKVVLIDDDLSCIGTANLDNRSLRLNFEVSMVSIDRKLAVNIQQMLEADLQASLEIDAQQLLLRNPVYRVAGAACRLLSPLL